MNMLAMRQYTSSISRISRILKHLDVQICITKQQALLLRFLKVTL